MSTETPTGLSLNLAPGGIAWVTLNRPEKRNAFDAGIIAGLTRMLTRLDQDDSVRVVVLAAAGKHFSAGADLHWMKDTAAMSKADNEADALALAGLMATLDQLSKPTIARVQGAAFGGALGLICCCDIAIASDQARFCLSEVKLGLAPAAISPYVVRAMSHRQARRYMLTAEVFDAPQAQALGVIHEQAPESELDTRVDHHCRALLQGGPQAQAACKDLLQQLDNPAHTQGMGHLTATTIARLRTSAEGQEGLQAFFDKRPPDWRDDGGEMPV
ncbi:MAG: enoyl-CoA hydratase/isomerase family protein [Halomonadaceae bacterium]|nr:MAG: enoyl-CoA hydratase/isomerase family protein [Halomonadaceae bacterium]